MDDRHRRAMTSLRQPLVASEGAGVRGKVLASVVLSVDAVMPILARVSGHMTPKAGAVVGLHVEGSVMAYPRRVIEAT